MLDLTTARVGIPYRRGSTAIVRFANVLLSTAKTSACLRQEPCHAHLCAPSLTSVIAITHPSLVPRYKGVTTSADAFHSMFMSLFRWF